MVDDDMPDAPSTNDPEVDATPIATPETVELSQSETTVSVQNGRRRGRRRVMKKKKVKDEEGYLGASLLFLCARIG
jgi:DNA polymerase delta subunit 3